MSRYELTIETMCCESCKEITVDAVDIDEAKEKAINKLIDDRFIRFSLIEEVQQCECGNNASLLMIDRNQHICHRCYVLNYS